MQVATFGGQTCNYFKKPDCWPNLQLVHVVELMQVNIARGTTDPGNWVCNLSNFSEQIRIISAEKDYSSYGLNTLGPLCLWQCFIYSIVVLLFYKRTQHSGWSVPNMYPSLSWSCVVDDIYLNENPWSVTLIRALFIWYKRYQQCTNLISQGLHNAK